MGSARLGWLVIAGLLAGGCFAMDWDYREGAGGAGGDPATSSSSAGGATTSITSTGTGGGTTGTTTSSSTSSSTGTGGAPPDGTVYCSGVECAPGRICCFSPNDGSGSCEDPGSCGGTEIPISCNDPGDCPGQICCGQIEGEFWAVIECRPTCDGAAELVQCQGDPSVCPISTSCEADPFLGPGYSFCY
ncbi:MAG: hypothetical protein IT372_07690 [Polyangiaceae bacterium]|nr:hypothetical protein [Polyangiaceae bacterium]